MRQGKELLAPCSYQQVDKRTLRCQHPGHHSLLAYLFPMDELIRQVRAAGYEVKEGGFHQPEGKGEGAAGLAREQPAQAHPPRISKRSR